MFESKAEYRSYFANVCIYLKMNYFLKQTRIDQGNFSRFMKGHEYEYLISWEKLQSLYEAIQMKIT
jgi:hypothetical protein